MPRRSWPGSRRCVWTTSARGVHTPRDGWCDPYQMLHGLRRKVIDLGGRVVADEVVSLDVSGKAVRFAAS